MSDLDEWITEERRNKIVDALTSPHVTVTKTGSGNLAVGMPRWGDTWHLKPDDPLFPAAEARYKTLKLERLDAEFDNRPPDGPPTRRRRLWTFLALPFNGRHKAKMKMAVGLCVVAWLAVWGVSHLPDNSKGGEPIGWTVAAAMVAAFGVPICGFGFSVASDLDRKR